MSEAQGSVVQLQSITDTHGRKIRIEESKYGAIYRAKCMTVQLARRDDVKALGFFNSMPPLRDPGVAGL